VLNEHRLCEIGTLKKSFVARSERRQLIRTEGAGNWPEAAIAALIAVAVVALLGKALI
jgi:hypothetical protein